MSNESSNPFPGLRPFRRDERHLFFGREEHTSELLKRLECSRFVAVVGTSGSGKSSLVTAGVLPELYRGTLVTAGSHWEIVSMRPGGDPLTNLAEAFVTADLYDPEEEDITAQVRATLKRSGRGLVEAARQSDLEKGSNLLLVVDQFEELFRFQRSGATRRREEAADFVQLLLEATRQDSVAIYVVLTMRSDYLGDCTGFRGLAEAVNASEYLIPRMNRTQRRSAIEGPVKVGGAVMAPRLLQKLLNELGDDPDQLPILQHALMRTWERWAAHHGDGEPVDLEHYEGIGGMLDALSQHADEIYAKLPDERHRTVARKLFKALTECGPDNRGIRRPAALAQLCEISDASEQEVCQVVEAFRAAGRTFLMPPAGTNLAAGTVVDISHESLMRVWKRLQAWTEEEEQSASIYRRLTETAQLQAEEKAGLYHDPDLSLTLNWCEEEQPNEAWAEQYGGQFNAAMAFLEKSADAERQLQRQQEELRQRELKQVKALAETQRSAARNFKRFAAGMALVALAAIAAFLFALKQKDIAREAETGAKQRQYISDVSLVQKALAKSNIGLAKSLLDAHIPAPGEPDLRSWEWYHLKTQTLSDETARLGPFDNNVMAIDYSSDGKWLGICERNGDFSLWDTVTERVVYKRQVGSPGLAFSPVEDLIALSGVDHSSVLLLKVSEHGSPQESSLNVGGHVARLAFSPEGKYLALYLENEVQVWDIDQRRELIPAISSGKINVGHITCLAISEDRVVFSAIGGHLSIHSLSDGKRLLDDFNPSPSQIASLAISPDGTLLATGSSFDESDVRLWDLRTGKPLSLLEGHLNMINCLEFSPDGKWLASGSGDQTIRLWDLAGWDRNNVSPPRSRVIQGNEDEVYTLAFRLEGNGTRRLASGSKGNWVRFFDLEELDSHPHHKEHDVYPHPDWSTFLDTSTFSFSPDSAILAAIGEDGKAMIIDAVTLEMIGSLPALGINLGGVLFFPDGKRLLASDAGGTLIVYDMESHKIVNRKNTVYSNLMPMGFSEDGLLATAGTLDERKVIFWDSALFDEVGSVSKPAFSVRELSSTGQLATFVGSASDLSIRIERARMTPQGHQPFRLLEAESDRMTSKSSFNLASNLSFSRTGKFLAAADYGGYVTIWDLNSPSNLNSQRFKTHMMQSHGVEIFQEGQRLATIGRGHDMLKIWDRESERALLVYESTGHSTDLQISPDESTIAVGSQFRNKGRLLLWRAPSPDQIQQAIDSKTVYNLDGGRTKSGRAEGIQRAIGSKTVYTPQWIDELVQAEALRGRRSTILGEAESLHANGQREAAMALFEPLFVSEAISGTPFTGATEHPLPLLSTLIQWESSPLIRGDALWSYSASVPEQDAAWHDPAFNDSDWEEGQAPLGFGDPWLVTTLDRDAGSTRYFRHRFTIAEANANSFLAINLMFDDGIVLYLNGTEILRRNMPDGPVDASTFASGQPLYENRFFPFLIPAVQLRTGENVLAAEVHNISARSSDLGFALTMTSTEHSAESFLRQLLDREDRPALIDKALELQPQRLREEWMRKLNAFLESK